MTDRDRFDADISEQPGTVRLFHVSAAQHLQRSPSWMAAVVLALATLACTLTDTGSKSSFELHATRTPWPTFTPTAVYVRVPVAIVMESTAPAVPLPSPSVVVEAPPTAPSAAPTPLPTKPSAQPSSTLPSEASSPTEAPGVNLAQVMPDASTPSPTDTPNDALPATATELPSPTSMPTTAATATSSAATPPTSTPHSEEPSWTFAGIRVANDLYEDQLVLYGDMINDTGTAQELAFVTGTFYDEGGQVIAGGDRTSDYWPVDVVPPGGQMPFELIVEGIQSAADFRLGVQAEPSSVTLRQDFEHSDLDRWVDESGEYCVVSSVRNPGSALEEYLVLVVVLYDGQNRVINFGEEIEPWPSIVGDDTLETEICVRTLNQDVARHVLRAWGH